MIDVEFCGKNTHIDVGHEFAKTKQTVGAFYGARDTFMSHRPLVESKILRMPFGNDRFSEERCGNGISCALDELDE